MGDCEIFRSLNVLHVRSPPKLIETDVCSAALCTVLSYEQFLRLIWQQAAISVGGLP